MRLQTFLIFLFLIISMMALGWIAAIRDNNAMLRKTAILKFCRVEIVLLLLIFSIISAIRYDVGTDYLSYLRDYRFLFVDRYEPIFKGITIFLKNNGFHYVFYFFVWAFIQIFLLYYTLRYEKILYVYIPVVLICGACYMSWMNGIRQDIAGCLFLFSTTFIYKRKLLPYILTCLVAMGFHSSAIILIPFYWILGFNIDFFKSKSLQYGLIIFASYIALTKADILEHITPVVEYFLSLAGESYSSYTLGSIEYFAELTTAGNSIAFKMQIIIDVMIIFYSNKLKDEFNKSPIKLYYQLYFGGTFMETLLINNLLLCRPFRYFRLFKLIMTAYLFCYLVRNFTTRNVISLFVLILLHLVMLIALIKNVQFSFFWQVL